MKTETDRHCIDLTQLSSREQLSALMDGALPEDQTRFLLRRLQHDAELAANWERWRIAGDAMRGIAPTQHLPVDFAQRVAASLHGVGPVSYTHLDVYKRQAPTNPQERKLTLAAALINIGWESAAIVTAIEQADDLYFDSISQIRMPTWAKGRVALIGDAAACPCLLYTSRCV